MRTGEPELVREITEDDLFVAARGNWGEMRGDAQVQRSRSAMCVPLTAGVARPRHDLAARHRPPLRAGRPRPDLGDRAPDRGRARDRPQPPGVADAVRGEPDADVGLRRRVARLPRRQRRRDPPLRLLPRGVPGDDDQGHPPARGHPAAARRRRRRRRARLARGPDLAAPAQGRHADRRRDHRRPDRLRGPPRRAGRRRTTSASASGSSAGSPTRRRWRRSAGSPAASRTTSTTC